jgi:pimeloyl-ACP methyl ester carboxylesterase
MASNPLGAYGALATNKRTLIAAIATPTILYFLSKAALAYFTSSTPPKDKIYRSPLSTIIQTNQFATCDYPPTSLPGARDIPTPYGSIRTYEWGPPTGRKILFVHGISTPCIALAALASELVEQHGCRVLLFDLFGRGYSDAPDPAACPQDSRLWTTQISLVLGSSELEWAECAIVGYSLGGGVAADWASWFPERVDSLVLVAPAGLLRRSRVAWWSKMVYGGFLPRGMVERMVKKSLVGGSQQQQQPEETRVGIVKSAEAEAPASADEKGGGLFPGRPAFSVATSVAWQADAHPGFVSSFISSIQNSPISGQQPRWQIIASRLDEQRSNPYDTVAAKQGLREGKMLILLGDEDSVIVADEVSEDAKEAMGEANVQIEVLAGGHDLPIAGVESCAKAIGDFLHWS